MFMYRFKFYYKDGTSEIMGSAVSINLLFMLFG